VPQHGSSRGSCSLLEGQLSVRLLEAGPEARGGGAQAGCQPLGLDPPHALQVALAQGGRQAVGGAGRCHVSDEAAGWWLCWQH
jgi:hypothetical protein